MLNQYQGNVSLLRNLQTLICLATLDKECITVCCCVSRAACVRTGLRYIAATLWPSVKWSERWRRDWRHRSTPFLPCWRAPETLCVCACVHGSNFLLIRVFGDAKRLRGRLSCQDVYYPGSWTSRRVRHISTLCLKIDAADISNWRRDGVTDGWRDGWVEKRVLMTSGAVYALISDCSLTVHIVHMRVLLYEFSLDWHFFKLCFKVRVKTVLTSLLLFYPK